MPGLFYLPLLLWLTSQPGGLLTSQTPDRIVYGGDTLLLPADPLGMLPNLPKNLFNSRKACLTTACWRGYEAHWLLADAELYLTDIRSCCYAEDSIRADLTALFGHKVVAGRVRADWVSGKLMAQKGRLLAYIHEGYASIYEQEIEFELANGQLLRTRLLDNSRTRPSIYEGRGRALTDTVHSLIRWDSLPPLPRPKTPPRVILHFTGNEEGRIDSVRVLKSFDPVFDREAIRAVKAIPGWEVLWRHGRFFRRAWIVHVEFSPENREKYRR